MGAPPAWLQPPSAGPQALRVGGNDAPANSLASGAGNPPATHAVSIVLKAGRVLPDVAGFFGFSLWFSILSSPFLCLLAGLAAVWIGWTIQFRHRLASNSVWHSVRHVFLLPPRGCGGPRCWRRPARQRHGCGMRRGTAAARLSRAASAKLCRTCTTYARETASGQRVFRAAILRRGSAVRGCGKRCETRPTP